MEVDLYPRDPQLRVARPLCPGQSQRASRSRRSTCGSTTMFPSTRSSSPDSTLVDAQPRFNHFVFRPRTPLAPGEARTLTFAVIEAAPEASRAGATSRRCCYNGTFVRNDELAPSIGVSSRALSAGREARKAHGLEPFAETPARRQGPAQPRPLAGDSDFIRFAITRLDQRRPDRARAGLSRARMERGRPALFPLRDGHADPEFLVGAVGPLRGGARQMERRRASPSITIPSTTPTCRACSTP